MVHILLSLNSSSAGVAVTTSGSFTVNNPLGTVIVTSTNSQTGTPVPASWEIPGPTVGSVTVDLQGSGTSQTYSNQPAGTYTINPTTSRPDLYALNSVKLASPVQKDGSMLALLKNMFISTAEAWNVASGTAQTLQSGSTDRFDVKWDPIANIDVASSTSPTLALSVQAGSATSGQVKVTNTGAAGSTLTWTTSSSAPWLSASPASDSTGLTNNANGDYNFENVTINANAAGLAVRTYTETIDFTGILPKLHSPTHRLLERLLSP